MKSKSLLVFLLMIVSGTLPAQEYYLPLSKDRSSGLYELKASLNDVSGHFIFDTGASGIVINGSFYDRLVRNGQLTRTDYRGDVQSVIADGSVVTGSLYNIRTLRAGNLTLRNVSVTVMPQANAGMLIGQTFLAKFGKVTLDFDNSRLILEKTSSAAATNTPVKELRLIPCFQTQDTFNQLKNVIQSSGVEVRQYSVEDKVPPANAIQRINSQYTVRYFDRDTEALSDKLADVLSAKFPGASVSTEDMRPYFGGSAIPAYIEIWIK
ncbi:MAG: retropepsin-like aspartic protease [Bacteroidota bacterium]